MLTLIQRILFCGFAWLANLMWKMGAGRNEFCDMVVKIVAMERFIFHVLVFHKFMYNNLLNSYPRKFKTDFIFHVLLI